MNATGIGYFALFIYWLIMQIAEDCGINTRTIYWSFGAILILGFAIGLVLEYCVSAFS